MAYRETLGWGEAYAQRREVAFGERIEAVKVLDLLFYLK